MYSKTQNASRAPSTTWRECSPVSSTQMSSPGATSRTRSAPMMSSAQDSLATQYLPSRQPRTSGRRPAGSRKATSVSFVMRTVEKAPCRRGSTSDAASSMCSASWEASSAAMISESDVERKETPSSRSSACSSTALMRLPLWPSASSRRSERCTGWALSQPLEPVVE